MKTITVKYPVLEKTREKYIKANEVIKRLWVVIKALEHTKEPNKRIETLFKANNPEYTVYFSRESYGLINLRIWGNGIDYGNGVYLCWNQSENTWDRVRRELEIHDYTDSLEQLEKEEALYPKLEEIEAQIEALRQKANDLTSGLGIPKSAKIRNAEHFWNRASYTTQKQFPLAFNWKQ